MAPTRTLPPGARVALRPPPPAHLLGRHWQRTLLVALPLVGAGVPAMATPSRHPRGVSHPRRANAERPAVGMCCPLPVTVGW